jgi:hypothetical protein
MAAEENNKSTPDAKAQRRKESRETGKKERGVFIVASA